MNTRNDGINTPNDGINTRNDERDAEREFLCAPSCFDSSRCLAEEEGQRIPPFLDATMNEKTAESLFTILLYRGRILVPAKLVSQLENLSVSRQQHSPPYFHFHLFISTYIELIFVPTALGSFRVRRPHLRSNA